MAEQRLVDANEAIEIAKEYYPAFGRSMADLTDLRDVLEDSTTVDAKPVVHGRWIDAYPDIEPNPMFMYGICSECGFEQAISKYLKYCPYCGAQMDEKEE